MPPEDDDAPPPCPHCDGTGKCAHSEFNAGDCDYCEGTGLDADD